jgi:penicillin amidase
MNLPRLLLRAALGRRLPITSGELRVRGPSAPVTIRRDKWGVPHIDAATEPDAFFGIGFCQGQDRAAQLEVLWRVGRGTLAEWVGPGGLAADRMSQRIGFRRSAEQQLAVVAADLRASLAAFAAGVTAGHSAGLTKKPHEFAIVGGEPSAWDAADALAVLKIQSFLLPSNWDVELARLRLLRADGPDAVTALDPVNCDPPGAHAPGSPGVIDRLAADLAALQQFLPAGGGSNNWVIAGSRTASGKPLLANDPHLAPTAPPPWYLVHVVTPDWSVCGATHAGTPAVSIGHNGFAAWGVTAGLIDNTDLFVETLGPDGRSVREADGSFTPCEVRREVIRVKGRPDVTEEVLVTPRGPVITGVLGDIREAISLRAVWLDPLPAAGFLRAAREKSFDGFRRHFAEWPALPLNIVYADADGTTGWQLVGQVPRRAGGNGLFPLPADAPGVGWGKGHVPFDEMPFVVNPEPGYFATANNAPVDSPGLAPGLENPAPGASPGLYQETAAHAPRSPGAFLGFDFLDPYRVSVILDELGQRADWDVAGCQQLQRNTRSRPWEELRPTVLALTPTDSDARDGLALLREWDGHVSAESPAAAVFELFVAELVVRVARAKAPNGWRWAVGEGGLGPDGFNLFADRRVAHLVRLVREQPAGWFPRPWPDEMIDVLAGVVRHLRRSVGPGPAYWAWGHLRRLRVEHLLFKDSRVLGGAFNLGPVPLGGDANTVCQAACRPTRPAAFAHNIPSLRAVFDLANLPGSTFLLPGGQSGNPCSPHYDDLFGPWQAGEAVTIPWEQDRVIREAVGTLRLLPAS